MKPQKVISFWLFPFEWLCCFTVELVLNSNKVQSCLKFECFKSLLVML